MRVYSPSQSTTYKRCGMLRLLQRDWEPRVLGKPGLARIRGSAVGVGAARHYAVREGAASAAYNAAAYALQSAKERGQVIYPECQGEADALPEECAKAVEKYIQHDPLPPSWTIEDIERDLGEEYGHARIDFGVTLQSGERVPLDLKVKRTLEARYRDRTLDELRHSDQMLHYAWAYGMVTQTSIMQFGIILVVLEPRFSATLDMTVMDQETLDTWLRGQERIWELMSKENEGAAPTWMAAEHWDRYGKCPFYSACLEHHWTPAVMERDFVRRIHHETL